MDPARNFPFVLALCAALASSGAAATVYTLVDRHGNVTYSNEPAPKGFDGEVTVIDTNATHSMPGDVQPPVPVPELPVQRRTLGTVSPGSPALAAARARAVAARRAYQDARDNPEPGDWITHAPLPSGATRGPSPEYTERLARLEKEAIDAESRLGQLRGKSP